MREAFTLIVICLSAFPFNQIKAQDTLKPFNNRWGTELNFNPFDGSFSLNNASGQLKLRKFNANNTAFRFAVTVDYKQDRSEEDSPYGTNPIHNDNRRQSFSLILNIGQEKHFAGTRRLSPYIGFEGSAGFKMSKSTLKSDDGERTIKGAWETREIIYYNTNYGYGYYLSTTYAERGFWSVGLNAITGLDFYVSKDFYVGCEVSFGLNYINYTKIDIEDDNSSSTYPVVDDSSWRFGPSLLNGIRIGYVF